MRNGKGIYGIKICKAGKCFVVHITVKHIVTVGIQKVYKKKDTSLELVVGIIVYAIVLMITSSLFSGFYAQNLFYAIIAAILLSFSSNNVSASDTILKQLK